MRSLPAKRQYGNHVIARLGIISPRRRLAPVMMRRDRAVNGTGSKSSALMAVIANLGLSSNWRYYK